MSTQSTVRVYVQGPQWFIRPRNTDWRYTRFSLPQLATYDQTCSIDLDSSWRSVLSTNSRYIVGQVCRRLGIRHDNKLTENISQSDLERSGAEVIFCHGGFPAESYGRPVIWQNSILDPEMATAAGHTESDLKAEKVLKRELFSRASTVLVSSTNELRRLENWFPELSGRIKAIPFFLPHLRHEEGAIAEKRTSLDGPLRILFVGNEARRKGLDRVYDAFRDLPVDGKPSMSLTVVSRFTDGTVRNPPKNVTLLSNLRIRDVLKEMRNHDVLVCPSRFESFGFVFIEAMSQGCVPLVPNWEVQREIVDNGSAGLICDNTRHSLRDHLLTLLEDRQYLKALSQRAWLRYKSVYAPDVVARGYSSMFHSTASLRLGDSHFISNLL